jgi:two-component system phosphate regulon sensor histidine kinase PhoR
VIVESEPGLSAKVEAGLLEQALVNLIDNAVKYSPPSTAVRVSARPEGGSLVIEVRDQGIGIPARDLPRVFERFYRVDKARSRELGGTGLGLAIVRHIAIAHGGTVSVESWEGEGSTFRIRIPLG